MRVYWVVRARARNINRVKLLEMVFVDPVVIYASGDSVPWLFDMRNIHVSSFGRIFTFLMIYGRHLAKTRWDVIVARTCWVV